MKSPEQGVELPDPHENIVKTDIDRIALEENLRDVFADRRFFLKTEGVEVAGEPSFSFEHLESQELRAVAENARVLSFLNGHRGSMLRRFADEASNPDERELGELFAWTTASAREPRPDLHEAARVRLPDLFTASSDADDLFERLSFARTHPGVLAEEYPHQILQATARAVGVGKPGAKWIDLIDAVYSDPNPQRIFAKLLDDVGFIPKELSTKRKFKGIGGKTLTADIDALRNLEDGPHGRVARFERSRMTNQLFLSGLALEIKGDSGDVTLDANGLFANLKNFHAHLPYGLMDPALPDALVRDGWLSRTKAEEAKLRMLESNSEVTSLTEARDAQMLAFAENRGFTGKTVEAAASFIAGGIVHNPDWFAGEVLQHELVIPDRVIEQLLADKDPARVFAAMKFAEQIGRRISGQELENHPTLFTDYRLFREVEEENIARAKILNEPRYYNAAKVARAFLADVPENDLAKKFFALRGVYKKTRDGDQHSFIEVLHDGRSARVLVNEEKQLMALEERNLGKLPVFERSQYERLEFAIKAFSAFSEAVLAIEKVPFGGTGYDALFESAIAFVVTNVSGDYRRLQADYEEVTQGRYLETNFTYLYESIQRTLREAHDIYARFLYENIANPERFVEHFSPEIRRRDIIFGQESLDDIAKHCAKDGYDPEQCLNAPPIRVVEIHYKPDDPSRGIPIHIEEEALDALRIYRDRPLVNVVGGARLLDPTNAERDFSNVFAASVLRAAHGSLANVAVPGMQSGIGNAFGTENIHYRTAFDHLAHAEQAHVFAISPGGNTHYPGNPFERAVQSENFAIAPVDSIITPFQAGWELRGFDRIRSPYLNHISYMESLYRRMSSGESRVTVVVNGGLYSIAEINESVKRGFPLLLVRDTGRFAEIASVLQPHFHELAEDIMHDRWPQKKIEEILRQYDNQRVVEEFLLKDFGTAEIERNVSEIRSEEFAVYKSFFRQFLISAGAHPERIKITTIADAERDLGGYLKRPVAKK